jgi:hypothetical protein
MWVLQHRSGGTGQMLPRASNLARVQLSQITRQLYLYDDAVAPDGIASVQILKQMEVPFEAVDILSNEMLRSGMKEYSQVLPDLGLCL